MINNKFGGPRPLGADSGRFSQCQTRGDTTVCCLGACAARWRLKQVSNKSKVILFPTKQNGGKAEFKHKRN